MKLCSGISDNLAAILMTKFIARLREQRETKMNPTSRRFRL